MALDHRSIVSLYTNLHLKQQPPLQVNLVIPHQNRTKAKVIRDATRIVLAYNVIFIEINRETLPLKQIFTLGGRLVDTLVVKAAPRPDLTRH